MNNIILVIIIFFFCIFAVFYLLFMRKQQSIPPKKEKKKTHKKEILPKKEEKVQIIDEANYFDFSFKPLDMKIDESKLVPIDKNIVAKIDAIVPQGALVSMNVKAAKSIGKQAKQLLQCNIPVERLAKVKDSANELRAFSINPKGIAEHGKMRVVNLSGAQAVNLTNAVMGIASMVVGQYYMKTISKELNGIKGGIDKIEGFLNNEYKAKVATLLLNVKEFTDFKDIILENDELRQRKLIALDQLKQECQVLLEQANESIENIIKADCNEYKKYDGAVRDVEQWYEYQQLLATLLQQITNIDFVLNRGNASREYINNVFNQFMKRTEQLNKKFGIWHERQLEKFKIDLQEAKKKREGADFVIHQICLWDKEKNNEKVNEVVIKCIINQMNPVRHRIKDNSDLFNTDVKIINKDGKLYYLPN